MAKYNFNDIFDPSLIKGIEDLQNRIANIDNNIKNIGKTKMDLSGGEKLKALEEQYKKIIAQNKELNNINKEQSKILKDLTNEEKRSLKEQEILLKNSQKEKKAALDKEKFEYKKAQDEKREANKRLKEDEKKADKDRIESNKKVIADEKKAEQQKKKLIAEESKYNKELIKSKMIINDYEKELKAQIRAEIDLEKAQRKEIKSLKDLQAENNRLKRVLDNLDLTQKENTKTYNELNQKILQNNNRLKNADYNVGFFQRNVGNYKSALQGLQGGFLAVGAAITGAIMLADKFINAYKEGSVEEAKLTEVMKSRVKATGLEIEAVKELITQQQNLGVIADDVLLAGSQQLATFASNADTINTLVPAMADLIAQQKGLNATTGDGIGIANLFGKALAEGNAGALRRVGITLTDSQEKMLKYGNESERAALLAEIVKDNVGKMNEALSRTPEGRLQNAKNIIGELSETIGRILIPIVASLAQIVKLVTNTIGEFFQEFFGDRTKKVSEFFDNLLTSLQKGSPVIDRFKEFFRGLMNIVKEFIKPFKDIFDTFKNLFAIFSSGGKDTNIVTIALNMLIASVKTIGNVVKIATTPIRIIFDILSKLTKVFRNAAESSDFFAKVGESGIGRFFQTIVGYIKDFTKGLVNLTKNIESFFNNLIKVSDRSYGRLGSKVGNKFRRSAEKIDLNIGGENDLGGGNTDVQQIDIFEQEKNRLAEEFAKKRLELTQQYKNDTEKIEFELLKFQQDQQLILLKFIEDNSLTDKKVEQEQEYLNIVNNIRQKEIEQQQQKYDADYNNFQNYMQNKQLDNEKELLGMQKLGVDEVEIKRRSIVQQIELQKEYLKFLQDNANAQNEIERKKIENQIIDLENQLNKIEDPKFWEKVAKKLGVSSDAINQIKQAITSFFNEIFNAMMNYYNRQIEKIDETIDKSKELQDQYQSNLDDLQSQLQTEEEAIRKKDELGVAFDVRERNRILKLMELEKKKVEEQKRIQEQALLERKKIEQKQQRLDIARATIGVATAVINALATQPFLVGLTLAALAAATGALQISQIKAQKFAKGTNFVERNGQPKGVDTIPAWLNEGERVIDSTNNSMIPRTFPNELIPLAVHHFLSNFAKDKMAANKEVKKEFGEKYLKEIAKNTANNKVYENGKLKSEIKGRVKITYK